MNNKPEKACRFKLYQVIGKKYYKKNRAIYLLWRKRSAGDHYNVLYLYNTTYLQIKK